MRKSCIALRMLPIVLGACLTPLAGCSKKMVITQYPAFYDGSISAIAVTPFRNLAGAPQAGNVLSDKLAALLMANGTYKVYNRNDQRVLTDEADFQVALGEDPAKVEAMFSKLGDVQAILTGAVTTFSGTSNSQQKQEPVYSYNAATKSTYVSGYRTFTFTRNEANVSVTAALLRRDGTTIYSTPVPVCAQQWAQGSPPQYDVNACLAYASDVVAAQLLEQFAVVKKEVEIDPRKAMRTATELFENKWTYADKFSADADAMYVVIGLPACCDRNRFALRVVRKDQREYLAEQEFQWDASRNTIGYTFNPQEIASRGGGPGTYTIKFFSGPEPIFTCDFRIY